MAAIKLKTYEDVWKLACQMSGQLMKEAAGEMKWEDVLGSDNITISDFVEKRFVGLGDYTVRLARRLGVASQRLEHVEDSPRKRAAKALVDSYREMFEEHLDKKMDAMAFEQVNQLLYDRRYEIPPQVRRQLQQRNSENAKAAARLTEDMMIYDTLFGSLFTDNAIKDRAPTDQTELEAEQRVFDRLAQAMPPGEDLDVFKRREGYVAQKALSLAPASASMVMEPCAATDVTADNYVEKIRGARPDRTVREWGVGTFDRMIEGLYTDSTLKALKASGTSFLSTVFVDGKPVTDWLPFKPNELPAAYEARARCEVVAYALEGKGKVDICPFEKTDNGYTLGNPIPMHVKVNLKEEIPVWRRALRFFHINSETKKEKAERISLDRLHEEDRLDSVRQQLAGVRERERHRQMARTAIERENQRIAKDDEAYFGFLGESEEAIRDQLTKELYNEKQERLLDTMGRLSSRVNFVRLFAIAKGMSFEEILSDDPALNDRKREIGKEMVNAFKLMDQEEYKEKHGEQADYQAYVEERRKEAFETVKQMHQAIKLVPYKAMPDMSPETLVEFYTRNRFMGKAMGDFFQCTSTSGRITDKTAYDAMALEMHSMAEIRHAADFVEKMASDGYVMSHSCRWEDLGDVTNSIASRENMRRFEKDTAALSMWGQVPGRIDEQWCVNAEILKNSLIELSNNPTNAPEFGHYLTQDKDPICVYDERTQQYHVGRAGEIRKITQEIRQADIKWEDEFEEIGLDDIRNADRRFRMKDQKATKDEAARIQEREQEQKLMAQAIDKSEKLEAADDLAYFGVLGEKGEDRGKNIQKLVQFQNGTENVNMLNTLHRRDSRISIVRAYALTKGMTPEEILSDDPALNTRKAQIGRDFLQQISVMGKEEYAKVHGSDAGYREYVAGKERECFDMAKNIHQKIMDFPYEPLPDLKAKTLAAAYEKNVFIRDISQDFNQIFEPLEKHYAEEMDEMTIKTRAMGEIRYMKEYSDFLATDSYVRPDTMKMSDNTPIATAVFARENLERFMEDTKDLTSCGQISEKIDGKWSLSALMLQADLSEKILLDEKWYRDAAHYLTTGQGKICYFDKAAGSYTLGSPQEIERIQREKEIGAGGKMKMSLDELGGGKKKFFKKPEQEDVKVLANKEFKKEKKGMMKSGPR